MRVLIKTTYELLRDPLTTRMPSGTITHKIESGDIVKSKQIDLCGKTVFVSSNYADNRLRAFGHIPRLGAKPIEWIVYPWMIKKVLVE